MHKYIKLKSLAISLCLSVSFVASAFETKAQYAVLIDYDTKYVLFEKEAHTAMAPSSMSKMLTTYIAFEALKDGQVKLEDMYPISEKAWRMEGTRMFIPLNAQVSFEDLLKGLIIQSGNDAAVALAEILAGSEEEFAVKMNETAKKLGMNESHFTNASGLPMDDNYSTPYDLATLAIHTINDFPEYYHYYSQTEFTYNKIKQGNRNGLLYRNIGADGLKTGHADDAGFGLTASVKKGNRRLIAVVNGLKTNKERTIETEALINYGLANFVNVNVVEKGHVFEKIKVSNGEAKEIEMISPESIVLVTLKRNIKQIKAKINYKSPIIAPIKAGDVIGELVVEIPDAEMMKFPLVSKIAVEKAGLWGRIQGNLSSMFD